jgi:outer membrane receptor protein involved in Fe transport
MKKLVGQLSAHAVLLTAFTCLSPAQSLVTGDITGVVSDPQGAVVPNAQVQLKSLQTGESQQTQTNGSGQYRFPLLKPGNYSITVSAQGLAPKTENVNVNLGQVTRADITEGVAGTDTTVDVSAEAPLMETDNANLATTYNTQQVQSLPAPGGDTSSYAYTAPGITMSTGGGYGGFSSYGLPSNSNLFTVNGSDNNDPYLNLNNSGASNLTLGANELQEVAVVQNGYSVQYGRQAGAQENITTKSGGNDYHGNANWWYNSKLMNANDWFNNNTNTPTPHAVNNQWAASFGGHIIKNKLFFFADQEGLRYVLPGGGAPVYLPTQQFQSYILNNIAGTSPSQLGFYKNLFNLYNGAPGANRATPVTAATDPNLGCGTFAGTAGFGPGGTPCAQSFRSIVNNLNTEWLLSTRVDWNIGTNDTLFGRFRTDHGVQATGTDPINPAFNAYSTQPEYEGQLNWTHILSSTATNQFIFANTWYSAIFGPTNLPAALNTFPTTLAFNDGLMNTVGGSDYLYPQGRKVEQYQFIDDFSKLIGNHNLKFGVNFRRNDVSDFAYGRYTSGLLQINSMTDFVNGTLGGDSQYTQAFANMQQVPIALYSLGVYAQDQWKPTSKLSITAGLRIDRNSNPTCRTNCFSRPAGSFSNLAADPNGTTPYNQEILTGQSNAFPNIQPITWEPRVGIAYNVAPHTVIRAGVGLFTDLFPAALIDRFVTNAPNVVTFNAFTGGIAPGTPGSAASMLATSAAAFNAGFANGASYSSLSGTGFTRPTLATSANQISNPDYLEYNFQIEREIGNHAVASVNYVGNYGYNEFIQTPWGNAFSSTGAYGLPTTRTNNGFGVVTQLNNQGYSNYNGLTSAVRWHARDFFQGSVSYTYAKAMDDCSNNCYLPFNALTNISIRNQLTPGLPSTLGYGPSDYDVRHSLNANFVLTAPSKPFNNNLMDRVFGGWSWAETFYFHSGYPFSVVNSAMGGPLNIGTGSTVLGQYLGGFAGGACTSPTTACLTPSEFAVGTAQNTLGNLNRNSFRGPGYFDTDLSLTKNFRLNERFNLGIGANAFNVLNHPNFDLPVNNVNSGQFGQIVSTVSAATSPYGSFTGSAVSGRVIQLHAKVTF